MTNIGTNSLEIHLGASSVAPTIGTSTLSIQTGAIDDLVGNASPSEGVNNRAIVTASIIINEVMFSTTPSNQYIELRNLGSLSMSLSGWTITNA